MLKRRDALKLGAAVTGAGLASKYALAGKQHEIFRQELFPQTGLVFPQNFRPSIVTRPSPPVIPFTDPLFIMPVARPVPQDELLRPELGGTPPDPERHQRFNEFAPQKFYYEILREAPWVYHSQAPYNQGSSHFTFSGPNFTNIAPGPTYKERYGVPQFTRRINDHPPIGDPERKVVWANPSFTLHLHNAHTASESDGLPFDYFNPGEFWDHHYGNFPAGSPDGSNDSERMNTLWYHDHRLDFTATNVYAGHSGFYLLFDEKDSDNERDPNPEAFRLPSGEFDIPLMLHDVQFDQEGQVIWDFFSPRIQFLGDPDQAPEGGVLRGDGMDGHFPPEDAFETENEYFPSFRHTTFGMLGDQITVNRKIQPYLDVKRRKYRFRILNGGPTRLYKLVLRAETEDGRERDVPRMIVISEDGNLLERPVEVDSLEIWVANRNDVIIDFSYFNPGDRVYLTNILNMRDTGLGPDGNELDPGIGVIQFRIGDAVEDPSRIPDEMRKQPDIDFSEVRRERLFTFDYDSGLFTVNGRLMDPNRVDAAIESGTAEIWTIRNEGTLWGHPIHTHFEEFQIFEINGKPIRRGELRDTKKDVVQLGPGDEIKFFGRWRDFWGPHVMHCHNVVHEDHSMMIRWDMVPPGEGD